jgi:hypothetical protein
VVIYGEPIIVPRETGKDAMETWRALLEARMRELTDRADRYWDR